MLYRYGAAVQPATNTNVYNVDVGYYPSTTYALWNIQYSVNLQAFGSNTNVLNDYTYNLTISDTHGNSVSFDPLAMFTDNAGWNGSKNVANGNESTDWGFQNSENLAFGEFAGLNFNPLANETYLVTLSLTPIASGSAAALVASPSVSIEINATPIPAALPLFGSGLGLMGFLGWRKKRKRAAASPICA